MSRSPIAVVGMACRYPDARSPIELWENVLAGRRAFRRLPPARLNLRDYYSAERQTPDATYGTQAALIEGYEFDRTRFRVAGNTFRSADMAHWLALDVASDALADAGFADAKGLPREACGVLLEVLPFQVVDGAQDGSHGIVAVLGHEVIDDAGVERLDSHLLVRHSGQHRLLDIGVRQPAAQLQSVDRRHGIVDYRHGNSFESGGVVDFLFDHA